VTSAAFHTWFFALADPACTTPPPPCPIAIDPTQLCDLADRHGVLPAAVRALRRLDAPPTPLAATLDEAEGRLLRRVAFALMLRKQLEPVATALANAGIQAVVLKGQAFADRLYPKPFLRPFTDIDLLLRRDDLPGAGATLQVLGYRRNPAPRGKYPGQYGEETWRLDDPATGALELHWNLVNSPSLRRRCSVELHHLALEPAEPDSPPRPTASALLLIAAVHAAASHRFDRLQPLCDVCQAARGAAGAIDAQWLTTTAERTGSTFALATALRLAGAIFGEPVCTTLANTLQPRLPCVLVRHLITPRAVLHATSPIAGIRRQLFREALKRL